MSVMSVLPQDDASREALLWLCASAAAYSAAGHGLAPECNMPAACDHSYTAVVQGMLCRQPQCCSLKADSTLKWYMTHCVHLWSLTLALTLDSFSQLLDDLDLALTTHSGTGNRRRGQLHGSGAGDGEAVSRCRGAGGGGQRGAESQMAAAFSCSGS